MIPSLIKGKDSLEIPEFNPLRFQDLSDGMLAAYMEVAHLHYSQALESLTSGEISAEGKTMKFSIRVHGKRPPTGYRIYVGMHGGGGCPAHVNEGQWENHKKLYVGNIPDGSLWIVPRSVEDVWNMWHLPYVDRLLELLFWYLTVTGLSDPNRMHITGYSAGGDGVYKLAPRMADRIAGAAMSAGHPNGASMLNCRNIAFSIQVGGEDSAYERNEIARKYCEDLQSLKLKDMEGYDAFLKIHEGKPHWMGGEDAKVFKWLGDKKRNPYPDKIVWHQCNDVLKDHFYWVSVPPGTAKKGTKLEVRKKGNRIDVETKDDFKTIILNLNSKMVDVKSPISVYVNGNLAYEDYLRYNYEVVTKSAMERLDPYYIFEGQVVLNKK